MLKWLRGDSRRAADADNFASVADALTKFYTEILLPVEKEFSFHQIYGHSALTEADFRAKPMVLLTGQYSVGKTTFIQHLLQRDYKNINIGPEPTTDRFMAIYHAKGRDEEVTGENLAIKKDLPFQQLTQFGQNFLSKFQGATMENQVLEGITLIDSPGVLSGDKQRTNRGYPFEDVIGWFADRADKVLVLFDVSKLDISDEFKRVLEVVRKKAPPTKIDIILNKADALSAPQLMRVYGSLMWSLGKVFATPEVCKVHIGSFWDKPLQNTDMRRVFENDETALYDSLAALPKSSGKRKVSDFIRRAKLVRTNAYILAHLRSKMPSFMGKDKEKKKLLDNLTTVYNEIVKDTCLPLGDFPNPQGLQETLSSPTFDFCKFPKIDKKKMEAINDMLTEKLPKLDALLSEEAAQGTEAQLFQIDHKTAPTPFGRDSELDEWLMPPRVQDYAKDFEAIGPTNGKITGGQAKGKLTESKLQTPVLHKIWTLADVDKDGALTLYEFALAMHFVKMQLAEVPLPATLPPQMAEPPEA